MKRKSTWFLIVFMICLLLSPLLINMASNLMLRGELREALEDFIEEYCDEEIEIYKIDYPLNTLIVFYYYNISWKADTSSEIHFFQGQTTFKSIDIVMYNSCTEKAFSFDQGEKQFEHPTFPAPSFIDGVPRNHLPYFIAFIVGVAMWWWLRCKEKERFE